MSSPGGMKNCKAFYECNVVLVPYVIDTSMGGGWAFPKGSEFLSIFKHYVFHTGNVNNNKSKDLPLRKQYSGNEMLTPSGGEGKLIN